MVKETKRVLIHVFWVSALDIPPEFEILSSTFADDWLETLKDGKHCDVTCLLQGQEYGAHQVMLCSASGFFCRLFQTGRVRLPIVWFLYKIYLSDFDQRDVCKSCLLIIF